MNIEFTEKVITIKVSYNDKTGDIVGFFPSNIEYSFIPEPFIEITEEEHKGTFGKKMKVINGILKEIVPSDEELLANAKAAKISQIKSARDKIVISDITTSKGLVFSADESSQFRIYVAVKDWDNLLTSQNLDPKTAQYPWGSTGLITKADLEEAYLLIQQRLAKVCGIQSPQLEARVNSCTTVEDILDEKGEVVSKGVNSIEIQF